MLLSRLLLIVSILFSFSFGCGGCVDAMAASAGANTINNAYDASDALLANIIDKHIDLINSAMRQEVMNNKQTLDIRIFEIDTVVDLKEFSFELDKNININSSED